MRLVLFDIDGTLLLSGGAGARALDRAYMELMGHPEAMSGIRPDGMTDIGIIQEMGRRTIGRSLEKDELDALRSRYLEYLADELPRSEGYRVMPGVVELLNRLAEEEDVSLGLITGNFKEAATLKLGQGGLDSYFSFGGFASDSASRIELTRIGIERGRRLADGPVPDSSILLVGDTVHDVRCGKKAGVRVVAVATGSTTEKTLRAEEPDYFLPDLSDSRSFLSLLNA